LIDVVHHVACRHRLEIEIWPPRVEVTFRDDMGVNPVNAQARFEATLYNSATGRVTWEVQSLAGGPGAGTIDASGRYLAPDKGALPSGVTDVVVATAVEDPLRKAYASVTLVGKRPAPTPQPRIEVSPKRVFLYYPESQAANHQNELIDDSNKMQLFRAYLFYVDAGSEVQWFVGADEVVPSPLPSTLYRYDVTGSGDTREVVITARIRARPTVKDEAKVVLVNYTWPKVSQFY